MKPTRTKIADIRKMILLFKKVIFKKIIFKKKSLYSDLFLKNNHFRVIFLLIKYYNRVKIIKKIYYSLLCQSGF